MNGTAAIERFKTPGLVLIRRNVGDVLVRGQWREANTTESPLLGVVQPMDHKTKIAMQLQRTAAAIFVFTPTELYTNDASLKRAADIVKWRGIQYEVQGVEDWIVQAAYFKATCVRVDQ